MAGYTIALSEVDRDSGALVGGKGANLGELCRAGVPVPDGFCLTTRAFRRFVDSSPGIEKLYVQLEKVDADDRDAIGPLSEKLCAHLGALPVPAEIRAELVAAWRLAGAEFPYAVRSSATAEDLPGASFAGQHDTFLNITDEDQLVDSVRRCWISLFTERAIGYRARNGFDHRQVDLAVVVQRLVEPEVSGVMFTADPVNGHRGTIVINAGFGLGEAIVSGLVNPDLYRIGPDGTLEKTIADKGLAIVSAPDGGTMRQPVTEPRRRAQALPDLAIVELAALGRRLQQHFDGPQDIEWAWDGGRFHVLQSRAVTTLYPLTAPPDDGRLHIYLSLGHQQMMLDAMPPLALSVIRNYFPFGTRGADNETRAMGSAGGRLFIDYTDLLHTRLGRLLFRHPAGTMDKRMGGAFLRVAERPEFRTGHRFRPGSFARTNTNVLRTLGNVAADLCWRSWQTAEAKRQDFIRREVEATRKALDVPDGVNRIALIQKDMKKSLSVYYRLTTTQFSAALARTLIERQCRRWLDDTSDLASLDKSMPGNVTTRMSLGIGDLADLVRGRPELRQLLEAPPEPFTLRCLEDVPGGAEFRVAFEVFLGEYGFRCPGELDITRGRWHSRPEQLFAGLLANASTGRAGEHRERFLAGEDEAAEVAARICARLRKTRAGRTKAAAMARLINVYRAMMGMREHQKFLTVQLYDVYRRVLYQEGGRLATAGILEDPQDVEYLQLQELRRLSDGEALPDPGELTARRRADHERARGLTVPRLMTSDGEILVGLPAEHSGDSVLAGLPVSAGVVEGRACVVLRPEHARIPDGSILIAPFTDPAWTPLFSAVSGMVVEIGGLMTHGAVVARELGLPAVVGVDHATKQIPDGARIRVDGSQGTVELLDD
ncbi:phosphoenolpyruvate synthase [Streptomyces sp. MZ04]|uniref:phosphoenolpyruvate synthase n=1 Tax=Streptomyces sp. MZ04 TaxID=2559236 RepID=UPI001432E612|nr:phosphoenolpyruvate synthase [Streptomyces sp. MZ04]